MSKNRKKIEGFTFLEMALVLLIISLLIAAIMVGDSLIRAANINSVLADAARYNQAITDFRNKYNALPGDMHNAESFWGTPAGGCPNGTGSPGGEVCNGNGDGVTYRINNTANIAEMRSEWVELANAGLIKGSYTYLPATGDYWEPGVSMPYSDINGASFLFFYGESNLGDGLYPDAHPYNIHWLSFGTVVSSSGFFRPVFTGDEAYGADKKVDDGKPGTGMLRAARNATSGGFTPNCHTTAVSTTAQYNQALKSEPVCAILFALPL